MPTITGTRRMGKWLGEVPTVRVQGRKPGLANNGFNVFTGQRDLALPALAPMLSGRYGHVLLVYDDGEFLAFASESNSTPGIYSFS